MSSEAIPKNIDHDYHIPKPKKQKRRSLIAVTTHVTGDGESRRWGCRSSLPMSSADAVDAENAAVRIMSAVNAQLDFSKSDLRLVVYDLKLNEIQKVEIPA